MAQTAPNTLSWKLEGNRLPNVKVTMRVAEAARAMVMREQLRQTGSEILPDCLHRPAEKSVHTPHQHAYWLPEDRDCDGLIDHLTVHVPAGFTRDAENLLVTPGPLIVNRAGCFKLAAAEVSEALMGSSRAWVSVTPFFGPRHAWKERSQKNTARKPKRGREAAQQLQFELSRLRGTKGGQLPAAEIRSSQFVSPPLAHRYQITQKRLGTLVDPVGGFFCVEFEAPVSGPLSVGLGAHFGLGRFQPFWAAGPVYSSER